MLADRNLEGQAVLLWGTLLPRLAGLNSPFGCGRLPRSDYRTTLATGWLEVRPTAWNVAADRQPQYEGGGEVSEQTLRDEVHPTSLPVLTIGRSGRMTDRLTANGVPDVSSKSSWISIWAPTGSSFHGMDEPTFQKHVLALDLHGYTAVEGLLTEVECDEAREALESNTYEVEEATRRRRDRVPRLRPGHRRGARRACRSTCVERPHRRVASHADARRHPHHDRTPPVLLPRRSPIAFSATDATTWRARYWSPGRCSAWTCASPRSGSTSTAS